MADLDQSPLLQQLRGSHASGCLSFYVPGGPGFEQRYWEAQLKDAYSSIEATLDGEGRDGLRRELDAVRDFLAGPDHRPTEIAIAIFSCAPDGVLEAYRLPENLARPLVYFGDRFELEPLLVQLERRPPAVVVVVEKDQARVFTVLLEDVEEVATTGWTSTSTATTSAGSPRGSSATRRWESISTSRRRPPGWRA